MFLFLSFPCICPEPVLAKHRVLDDKNSPRAPFLLAQMYSAKLPASPTELSFLTNPTALKLSAEGEDPRPFNSSVATPPAAL
jgi:hypothetical protein